MHILCRTNMLARALIRQSLKEQSEANAKRLFSFRSVFLLNVIMEWRLWQSGAHTHTCDCIILFFISKKIICSFELSARCHWYWFAVHHWHCVPHYFWNRQHTYTQGEGERERENQKTKEETVSSVHNTICFEMRIAAFVPFKWRE